MIAAPAPASLAKFPRLGQWLDLGADGRVQAYTGKVDIGQGISHALRLIVAEELHAAPEQVHMVTPGTALSPDEGVTSGSLSIQHSGASLRLAAAHLREACRARFAVQAGVDIEAVALDGGVFRAAGARATYADLVDAEMLAADIDAGCLAGRGGRPSAFGDLRRSDIESKVLASSSSSTISCSRAWSSVQYSVRGHCRPKSTRPRGSRWPRSCARRAASSKSFATAC